MLHLEKMSVSILLNPPMFDLQEGIHYCNLAEEDSLAVEGILAVGSPAAGSAAAGMTW